MPENVNHRMSDKAILAVFTAGHLIDDIYVNVLPPLVPVLVSTFGLTFAHAGLAVTFFTITSSVAQPLFGYAIDRYGIRRMAALGLMMAGMFMGLLGVVRNYYLVLVVVTLAGLGPAMFHPHASAVISQMSSSARGRLMSIFLVGGNLGFATGPLLVGMLTTSMGMRGMLAMVIPGLLIGIYIWRCSPSCGPVKAKESVPFTLKDFLPAAPILLVAILRSWIYFSVLSYIPSYFVHRGNSVLRSNTYLTIMLLAGVAGQLAGGWLSDKFGRKEVTRASLLFSAPLLYMFLNTTGGAALVFFFLFGFTIMASFSVTLVMIQEVMSKHVGMASGLMIGFALGVGGIGVLITGHIADVFGIHTALNFLVVLPIIAGIFTAFVPSVRCQAREEKEL